MGLVARGSQVSFVSASPAAHGDIVTTIIVYDGIQRQSSVLWYQNLVSSLQYHRRSRSDDDSPLVGCSCVRIPPTQSGLGTLSFATSMVEGSPESTHGGCRFVRSRRNAVVKVCEVFGFSSSCSNRARKKFYLQLGNRI